MIFDYATLCEPIRGRERQDPNADRTDCRKRYKPMFRLLRDVMHHLLCIYLQGLPSRTVPKDYHSVSWPLQVDMEAEGRRRELVGDIMRLLVEIGSLKDGRPALGPLDLDNLEGTLREVKERNRQLREECGQMQSSWRREREQARR